MGPLFLIVILFIIITVLILVVNPGTPSETLPSRSYDGVYAAVVVYHGPTVMKEYVITNIKKLIQMNYRIYFVSNGDLPDNISLPSSVKKDVRENAGYDWGGWSYALERWPELKNYSGILFTNDSYYIYKSSEYMNEIISRHRKHGESWGLSMSNEYEPHLQSYFIEVPKKDYDDFSKHIHTCEKGSDVFSVIQNCEVKTLVHLPNAKWEFSPNEGRNPYLEGVNELIGAGFPVVKRRTPRDVVSHIDTQDFFQ